MFFRLILNGKRPEGIILQRRRGRKKKRVVRV
jgi:hypothetical protein